MIANPHTTGSRFKESNGTIGAPSSTVTTLVWDISPFGPKGCRGSLTVSLLSLCPSCPFSNAVRVNLSQPKRQIKWPPAQNPLQRPNSHKANCKALYRKTNASRHGLPHFPWDLICQCPLVPTTATGAALLSLQHGTFLSWGFALAVPTLPGKLFPQIPTGLALTPFRPLLNIAFSGHLYKTATPSPPHTVSLPSFSAEHYLPSNLFVNFTCSLAPQLDCKC